MGGGKKGGGMQMSAEEQAMMDAIKAEQKASMGPGIDRTADDHSGAPMTVIEAKIEVVRDPTDTAGMGTARLAFWKVKDEPPSAPDPVEDSQAAYQRFVRRHSARATNVKLEGESTAQKEAKMLAQKEAEDKDAKVTAGRQRLVFTTWLNVKLSEKNIVVNDLTADLKDGFVLFALLEVLSGGAPGDVSKMTRGNMRVQHVANMSIVFRYLKETVKPVGVGIHDIVDSTDEARVLLLVWSIIAFFMSKDIVGDGGAGSGVVEVLKTHLLEWAGASTLAAAFESCKAKYSFPLLVPDLDGTDPDMHKDERVMVMQLAEWRVAVIKLEAGDVEKARVERKVSHYWPVLGVTP